MINRLLLLLVIMAVTVPWQVRAQVPGPPISGLVVSNTRGPLGGVTVSLAHPVIGRSAPTFTGANGYYWFGNVPPRPEPYYIEAYWGNQLIFRGQLVYQGVAVPFNITLP